MFRLGGRRRAISRPGALVEALLGVIGRVFDRVRGVLRRIGDALDLLRSNRAPRRSRCVTMVGTRDTVAPTWRNVAADSSEVTPAALRAGSRAASARRLIVV